jgi:hypothetical protein
VDERRRCAARRTAGTADFRHCIFHPPTPMNTSFDTLTPMPPLRKTVAAEPVRSNMDWVARCSKRLVGLNPSLGAEQALDLARDLSLDGPMRKRSPERAAEHQHKLEQQRQADAD